MQLFLSHATESKPLVRRIVAGLPAHVDIWLDRDELVAGERFGQEIERAIAEKCDFLVAFLDEPALARDWVPREIGLGLRREADLKRTFVLPLLLQDVRGRLHAAGPIADRLYLTAFDHSDEGLAQATHQLAAQLFALASKTIESLRDLGRRGLLDAFARELTAYKQAAFRWRASLGNSLAVLTTNQAAFDHVRESVDAYNRAADPFVARLALHRDRINDAWSAHRGLCEDMNRLVNRIEQVYRGEMYALNRIHEMVHETALGARAGAATPARLRALDRQRVQILGAAGAALDEVSAEATRLVGALEREIA